MRPVSRGERPLKSNGTPKSYSSYGRARRDLIDRMGQYCSYCNQKLPASLAVEHVQPKAIVPELELEWDNFLLGCTNCNSTKGDKPVDLDEYLWPDIHNTHLAFTYTPDGKVNINSALSEEVKIKAQNMLDLVGLQKYPDNATASDRRWKNRRDTFKEANIALVLFENALEKEAGEESAQLIEILVRNNGFFSIWMHVFENHPMVKKHILSAMTGTATNAFDQNGNPLRRTNSI